MACRNLERAVAPSPAAEAEPPLAEVTSDPIVRQLMKADGVETLESGMAPRPSPDPAA